jgi:hypothetical protein
LFETTGKTLTYSFKRRLFSGSFNEDHDIVPIGILPNGAGAKINGGRHACNVKTCLAASCRR